MTSNVVICAWCGSDFRPGEPNQLTCSRHCARGRSKDAARQRDPNNRRSPKPDWVCMAHPNNMFTERGYAIRRAHKIWDKERRLHGIRRCPAHNAWHLQGNLFTATQEIQDHWRPLIEGIVRLPYTSESPPRPS